ncbi:amino acid adenylation domain-containing protein [Streptomyces montanisoli]|uniref:Amino acid adenylation domain-containing protein n=1 Tax=Streptomyces montanisoli TaxID=2798581 RepID=A0A940RTS4_9ACTN|nr:amino acid adenylation domain-containing protein [Streptomyces montanisoli]MBP0456400.1 amino acid adenylation domain-containing protein [Streptomyces montanisoli]
MSLYALVVDAAARTPDALAVSDLSTSLSYGELDARADRFAAALRARGVRPGDRVVVWTGKTAEAVAVAQAVLRIGAIHVPVPRGNPPERVARIVADARAALVVTDHDGQVPGAPSLSCAALAHAAAPGTRVAHATVGAADPAYILYTSGSTGTPKGVCLSHGNALAFVDWACRELRLTAGDRLANHASFGFDLSVFDLYGAFRAGASVHLVGEMLAQAAEPLVDFVLERRITVWYSVPSALVLMTEYGDLRARGPGALRACVCAGEPFPLNRLRDLRRGWPGVRMLNWYGPTETNVCTSYEVTAADLDRTTAVPIGSPAAGNVVTVDGGEIVVSGPTVMLGYWGGEPRTGPYRTGDLGRYGTGGLLEYRGRVDTMVKLRGYRVEPAEVEQVLVAHDTVRDAVVLGVGTGGRSCLHAFVVPEAGTTPEFAALRRHCASFLPAYMNIDALHAVGKFPRTRNGKVDLAALSGLATTGADA